MLMEPAERRKRPALSPIRDAANAAVWLTAAKSANRQTGKRTKKCAPSGLSCKHDDLVEYACFQICLIVYAHAYMFVGPGHRGRGNYVSRGNDIQVKNMYI